MLRVLESIRYRYRRTDIVGWVKDALYSRRCRWAEGSSDSGFGLLSWVEFLGFLPRLVLSRILFLSHLLIVGEHDDEALVLCTNRLLVDRDRSLARRAARRRPTFPGPSSIPPG